MEEAATTQCISTTEWPNLESFSQRKRQGSQQNWLEFLIGPGCNTLLYTEAPLSRLKFVKSMCVQQCFALIYSVRQAKIRAGGLLATEETFHTLGPLLALFSNIQRLWICCVHQTHILLFLHQGQEPFFERPCWWLRFNVASFSVLI